RGEGARGGLQRDGRAGRRLRRPGLPHAAPLRGSRKRGRPSRPRGSTMKRARWNYAVPVRGPLVTAPLVFFSSLAAIALALSAKRLVGGLAFTGMNDDFAIGVWKTFNVMTLTALG